MTRPSLIRSNIHPYHITSRCSEKFFFPLPLDEVWEIMLTQLHKVHQKHRLGIHAFVLMGNHFHLLCHTPEANIEVAMQAFLRSTSFIIGRKVSLEQNLWEGRYKWSVIASQTHYYQVYRYIFQNPIRAQIVERVEDYPYSTLKREVPFPIHSFLPLGFGGQEGEKLWLNELYDDAEQRLIRNGLTRANFDINQKKLKLFLRLSRPPSDE